MVLSKEIRDAYDLYASAALGKLALIDGDEEFNTEDEIAEFEKIKDSIVKSAHDYAYRMVKTREDFINKLLNE